jgi:hypothetical protein
MRMSKVERYHCFASCQWKDQSLLAVIRSTDPSTAEDLVV